MAMAVGSLGFAFTCGFSSDWQRQFGDLDPLHGHAGAIRRTIARHFTNCREHLYQSGYALSTLTVHDKVMQGISLAQALRQLSFDAYGYPAVFSKLYPSLLVQLIDIGEQSGTLSALLNKAADAQDEALAHQVQSMTQLIEPLLVVVLGGLVGGMVVALYLPVFQLGQIM